MGAILWVSWLFAWLHTMRRLGKKQAKIRNETGSNPSLGTRLTRVKCLGRKRFCEIIPYSQESSWKCFSFSQVEGRWEPRAWSVPKKYAQCQCLSENSLPNEGVWLYRLYQSPKPLLFKVYLQLQPLRSFRQTAQFQVQVIFLKKYKTGRAKSS